VLAAVVDAERAERPDGPALVLSHAADAGEAAEFEGEADGVARLLGTRATHHAPRAALTAGAPAAGQIHLVCHGFFDPDDPLASGVVLADGVMHARDWLTVALRSDLVTLSACETGREEVRQGDELTGLARALLQAGSTSVLLTLWRVYSDASVDWMSRFYAALTDPSPASHARAFQRATVELRARDPDPRAWAPFVLIGDPS
jgi:CHAT domain-containing protein